MYEFVNFHDDYSRIERELKEIVGRLEREKVGIMRNFFELLPNFVIMLDGSDIRYLNASARKLLCIEDDADLMNSDVFNWIHESDKEQLGLVIKNKDADKEVDEFQVRFVSQSKKILYLVFSIHTIVYDNEEVLLFVGRDITEFRNIQSKCKILEDRLKNMFHSSPINSFVLNVVHETDFFVEDINPVFEKNIGLSREFCVGKTIQEVLPFFGYKYILNLLQKCVSEKMFIESSDGDIGEFNYTLQPLIDVDGKVNRIYGSFTNVLHVESKNAKLSDKNTLNTDSNQDFDEVVSALKHKKSGIMPYIQTIEFLHDITNNISDSILAININNSNIFFANDRFCKTFGYNSQELQKIKISDLLPTMSVEDMIKKSSRYVNHHPGIFFEAMIAKNGTVSEVEFNCKQIEYNGEIFLLLFIYQIIDAAYNPYKEELKLFIDGPNIAYKVLFEDDWPAQYISSNVKKLLGYDANDFVSGKIPIQSIFHPDDLERVFTEIERFVMNGVDTFKQEYRVLHKDGYYVWMSDFTYFIRNDKGEITHYNGYLSEITESKNRLDELIDTEVQLKIKEKNFRDIFENSSDGILLLEVNSNFENTIGVKIKSFVGKFVSELKSQRMPWLNIENIIKYAGTGTTFEEIIELKIYSLKRKIQVTYIPVQNETKQNGRLLIFIRDITEQHILKRDLELNRTLLSDAEDTANLGHFFYHVNTEDFYCSQGIYKILELPAPNDTHGIIDIYKYVHVDDLLKVKQLMAEIINKKSTHIETIRVYDAKGLVKTVKISIGIKTDSNESVLFGVMHDFSDLYKLRNQVTLEEEKLRLIVDNSPIGIYLMVGFKPIYANRALLSMCGLQTPDDLETLTPLTLIHPDDRSHIGALLRKIRLEIKKQTTIYQVTIRTAAINNQHRYVDLRIVSCLIDGNSYLQLFVVDITEEMDREKLMSRIASDTLYANKRKEVIKTVKAEIDTLLLNISYRKSDFKKVIKVLEDYSKDENDWELFNEYFDRLHPDFISNLRIFAPDLSENDIKHCVCIKLNIDTKQIARLFNVMPATIQTARVRLKKKLNLPEYVDLRTFLHSV